MYKNAIFIHAALLSGCTERLTQFLDIIKSSGLIDNVDFIYICSVGSDKHIINESKIQLYNQNQNIFIHNVSVNLADYETPTLQFLYDFCNKNLDYKVLYLHTKNVGKEINLCIEDQIEYTLYFLVTKWNNCVDKLLQYDICGVDLRDAPTLHYSGNFWWTKSSYIISLPSPLEFNDLHRYPNPLNSLRHNQEFWICYKKNKQRYYCSWDCGISCYERHIHRYQKHMYIEG